MPSKKYYWLKLRDDFFQSPKIKKLRKIAGGDTFTIIYLKMQLLSIKSGGILEFTGVEDTFEDEMSLVLDEDADNVRVTIAFLIAQGLMEQSDDYTFLLTQAASNIGSEDESAERVRRFRTKALQCNANVTHVGSKCNANVTLDIDKEIDKDIDKDKELDREKKEKEEYTPSVVYSSCSGALLQSAQDTETKKTKPSRFIPPTVDQVKAYCEERGNGIDPQRFVDFYSSKGWMVGKNKMKDWRAAIRGWECRNTPAPAPQQPQQLSGGDRILEMIRRGDFDE